MVTLTIGMGQYGGGVDGKAAVVGMTSRLAVTGAVVVFAAALVGGLVVGERVGAMVPAAAVGGRAVVVTGTAGAETGPPHVVVRGWAAVVSSDEGTVGAAGWRSALEDATTRRAP